MRLTRFLPVLLIVFTSFNLFGQSWTNITPSLNLSYRGVHFADENLGYAVGDNGTIIRTVDGGATWTTAPSSPDSLGWLDGVFCFSLDTVFVSNRTPSALYRTTDGGATWVQLTVEQGYTSSFNDIHFIDDQTGFVTGYSGKLFKTNDFGDSWTSIEQFGSTALLDIEFASNEVAFLGTYAGPFKSVDGGNTWTEIQTVDMNIIHALHFRNENHGIMTGWSFGSLDVIAKTYDGGQTWDTTVLDVPAYYTGIHLVDSLTGFMIHNSGGSGTLSTADGGYDWSEFQINACSGLWDLCFPSDNIGYAVGHSGIVKYENLSNDISDMNASGSIEIHAYPNPFVDDITIALDVSKQYQVSVFNCQGQLIYSRSVNGQTRVDIDAFDWSEGMYFVRINDGSFVAQTRIVKS